jgi:hypothetical protein
VAWCVEKADAQGHQKTSANAIGLSSHAVSHADRPRQRYIFWVRVRNVAVTGKWSDG